MLRLAQARTPGKDFVRFLAIVAVFLFCISSSVVTGSNLDVPFFSQGDVRWSDEFLDNSPFTFGGSGCALMSLAMTVNYYGAHMDPKELNRALTLVGALGKDGNMQWARAKNVCGNKVSWEGRIDFPDWDKVSNEVSQGHPVIADVRTPRSSQHFIVFCGVAGNDYYFYDPADRNKQDRIWPNLLKYSNFLL